MNLEEKKYRNKITYISFILAILVVIEHAYNVDVYHLENGGVWLAETWIHRLTEIAVPMFFVMSGYLFYVNYDRSKLASKLKSRVFSLLVPYLLWNEIGFLYYQIISLVPMVRNSMNSGLEPLSVQSVITEAIFGYHNITWFLRYLMLFTVMTPLLYPLLRRKWSVVILSIVFILGSWNGYMGSWFYYLTGAYIAVHLKDFVQTRTYTRRQITVAGIVLAVSMTLNVYNPYDIPQRLLYIVGIVALWIVMDIVRIDGDPAWWARLSFYIYLSHRMILESVEKLFLIVLGVSDGAAVLDFLLAPIITMGILITGAYMLRRMPHVWRILNGGR